MLLIYLNHFWTNFDRNVSLSLDLILTDHTVFCFIARVASSITLTGSVSAIVKTTKDLIDGAAARAVDRRQHCTRKKERT